MHPAFPQQPHIPVDEPRAYALPSTPPRMLHPAAHPPHQNPFMVDLHDQVGAAAPCLTLKCDPVLFLGLASGVVTCPWVPSGHLLLGSPSPEPADALVLRDLNLGVPLPAGCVQGDPCSRGLGTIPL